MGHVEIPGIPQPPNSGQLTSATKLRLGMPFVEADRNQAVESLKDLLRQNGFYHANVSAKVEYRPSTEQANLTFDIESGDRARFDQPVISGDPQRPQAAIVRATHWKRLYGLLGWQQVTDARVRQGLENVRHFYEKHNLLESKVTLTRLDYEEQTNRVKPSIDIQAGPRIAVRVDGARIGRGKLTQLLPIYQERSVDPDLLTEGDRNLAQYFQVGRLFRGNCNPFDKRCGGGVRRAHRLLTTSIEAAGINSCTWISAAIIIFRSRQFANGYLWSRRDFPVFRTDALTTPICSKMCKPFATCILRTDFAT